jgi:hypothetical protein
MMAWAADPILQLPESRLPIGADPSAGRPNC